MTWVASPSSLILNFKPMSSTTTERGVSSSAAIGGGGACAAAGSTYAPPAITPATTAMTKVVLLILFPLCVMRFVRTQRPTWTPLNTPMQSDAQEDRVTAPIVCNGIGGNFWRRARRADKIASRHASPRTTGQQNAAAWSASSG